MKLYSDGVQKNGKEDQAKRTRRRKENSFRRQSKSRAGLESRGVAHFVS